MNGLDCDDLQVTIRSDLPDPNGYLVVRHVQAARIDDDTPVVMLDKLQEQGWLTIEGRVAEHVYPTVAALRWTKLNVSVAVAEATIRRLHRQ